MAFLRRFGLTAACLLFAPAALAQNLQLYEPEIKAGLLYNFLKYIDWPPGDAAAQAPLSVCVFGGDPFGGYLQPIATRTVKQRPILLRFIDDIPNTGACDLLFISTASKSRWNAIRDAVAGKSVLTVSDFPGFTEAGGMIEFGRKNQKISVLLNKPAIENAHMQVEDRLLKLVTVVDPTPLSSGSQ